MDRGVWKVGPAIIGASQARERSINLPRSQRRRRRGPAQYQGPRKTKPPFPINLIFNVKAFYLFFIIVMIASMAAVGLGSGLGSSTDPPDFVENDETPVPTPATQTFPDGPAPVIDASQPHIAILTTPEGEIEIELVQDAPSTVNSFAFLAAKNFYDGTVIFFKDQFFAQGGDPTCVADGDFVCTGLGGPGYSLTLEDSGTGHVQWAVVAPAIGGGDDSIHGSQFRILLQEDERQLNETVFGVVTSGQEILEALPDMKPCSLVDVPDCNEDLTGALLIEDIRVVPAN